MDKYRIGLWAIIIALDILYVVLVFSRPEGTEWSVTEKAVGGILLALSIVMPMFSKLLDDEI